MIVIWLSKKQEMNQKEESLCERNFSHIFTKTLDPSSSESHVVRDGPLDLVGGERVFF